MDPLKHIYVYLCKGPQLTGKDIFFSLRRIQLIICVQRQIYWVNLQANLQLVKAIVVQTKGWFYFFELNCYFSHASNKDGVRFNLRWNHKLTIAVVAASPLNCWRWNSRWYQETVKRYKQQRLTQSQRYLSFQERVYTKKGHGDSGSLPEKGIMLINY